jgi:hypothetical protein
MSGFAPRGGEDVNHALELQRGIEPRQHGA